MSTPFGRERPDWMTRAACRGATELFFDDTPLGVRRAKQRCLRCEVRQICYEFAMADPTLQGIWGRTTARERDVARIVAS